MSVKVESREMIEAFDHLPNLISQSFISHFNSSFGSNRNNVEIPLENLYKSNIHLCFFDIDRVYSLREAFDIMYQMDKDHHSNFFDRIAGDGKTGCISINDNLITNLRIKAGKTVSEIITIMNMIGANRSEQIAKNIIDVIQIDGQFTKDFSRDITTIQRSDRNLMIIVREFGIGIIVKDFDGFDAYSSYGNDNCSVLGVIHSCTVNSKTKYLLPETAFGGAIKVNKHVVSSWTGRDILSAIGAKVDEYGVISGGALNFYNKTWISHKSKLADMLLQEAVLEDADNIDIGTFDKPIREGKTPLFDDKRVVPGISFSTLSSPSAGRIFKKLLDNHFPVSDNNDFEKRIGEFIAEIFNATDWSYELSWVLEHLKTSKYRGSYRHCNTLTFNACSNPGSYEVEVILSGFEGKNGVTKEVILGMMEIESINKYITSRVTDEFGTELFNRMIRSLTSSIWNSNFQDSLRSAFNQKNLPYSFFCDKENEKLYPLTRFALKFVSIPPVYGLSSEQSVESIINNVAKMFN